MRPLFRHSMIVVCALLVLTGIAALLFAANNGFKLLHLHSAYVRQGVTYQKGLVNYRPDGPYFNYGNWAFDPKSAALSPEGLPWVQYDGVNHLNPVAAAEYGLTLHHLWLKGEIAGLDVARVAQGLIGLQDAKGAFRFPFRWRHYLNARPYEPGWVSGMAQGQALSLFSRTYRITGDRSFIEAGRKALTFLQVPLDQGGPMATLAAINPDWSEDIFFEEYVLDPPVYTLNGFIYVLLGLYDWSKLPDGTIPDAERALAADLFRRGLASLEKLLPLYSPDLWSVYDLGYLTHGGEPHYSARYHGTHIYQLTVLAGISGSAIIGNTAARWASWVDPEISTYHRVATWRYR